MKNRKCKNCKKEITRHSKSGLCGSCSQKGKIISLETRKNMSKSQKGKHLSLEAIGKIRAATQNMSLESRAIMSAAHKNMSEEIRTKISNAMKGKTRSIETRKRMSIAKTKEKHPMYGKSLTLETKRKCRISAIKRIEREKLNGYQLIPSWNLIACRRIDDYGKQYNYNFRHAMNGGEFFVKDLGFFVDGYDKEKNTVIEYYEKRHDNQVQKDFERETEICNHLGCDFIILWQK